MGNGLQDRQEDGEEAVAVPPVRMGSFHGLTRSTLWGPTQRRCGKIYCG